MLLKNLIWQEIQTALAATVFTVLVWIYAEGETVKTHELTLDIRFDAATNQPVIIKPLQPLAWPPVPVRMRCANAQWNEVKTWESKPFVLTVTPGADPTNFEQTVNLLERLRGDPRFTSRGVVVEDARAPDIRLYVESTVTRALPVTISAGPLELIGQPAADPDKVEVTVPASGAKGLDTAKVEARLEDIEGFDATKIPEGVPVIREAPVKLLAPGVKDERIRPARVKLTFTLRRGTEREPISAVPISVIYLSPADSARFAVQLQDQFLPDTVEVTGPRAVIERIRERIRQKEIPLRAYVTLSTDDLEKRIVTKQVEIKDLPPGLTITTPVTLPSVKLQVVPKGN